MSLVKKAQLAYNYGELEADYKRLLRKNWLNEADTKMVSDEFEKIKESYKILEKKFIHEEALALIDRMKEIPLDTFLVKKEKFMDRFEEWKKSPGKQ